VAKLAETGGKYKNIQYTCHVAKPWMIGAFLGMFTKLQNSTISFVMLSVRMEELGSHWTDIDET
jgi:hypothetical protein